MNYLILTKDTVCSELIIGDGYVEVDGVKYHSVITNGFKLTVRHDHGSI